MLGLKSNQVSKRDQRNRMEVAKPASFGHGYVIDFGKSDEVNLQVDEA